MTSTAREAHTRFIERYKGEVINNSGQCGLNWTWKKMCSWGVLSLLQEFKTLCLHLDGNYMLIYTHVHIFPVIWMNLM